jgi:HEPN domain-containing protein
LSPSPEQIDYAEMLRRLAAGDLYACRKLADDANVDDHIIGFLAQQAVEKVLKAALVLAGSELPRTHDLDLLVEQVEAARTKVPGELSDIDWLTPWAAELRYDEPIALDRAAALAVTESAVGWAASLLEDPASDVSSVETREKPASLRDSVLFKVSDEELTKPPDTEWNATDR